MKKRTKVFYAVQVSNFTITEDGPKWLLRNDACMNIAIGIISNILEQFPDDFEFLVKLPFASDCDDIFDLEQLFQEKYLDRIEFYREDLPVSPVTSRYNFNFAYHEANKDLLSTVDIMINDENTLTKNWRVFFDSIGRRFPIVSTNYFMDSPISPKSDPKVRYYERQMESLIASDMFAYPVQSALDEALQAYDYMFKDRKHLGLPAIWNIGAYYGEIKKGHKEKSTDKIKIYFGNRITDSAGRYTNWHLFAEAIGHLSKMVDPSTFEATILNPTRKVSDEQAKLINDLSNGHVIVLPNDGKFTREEYVEFINDAHISCNLFTNEVHGGLTHVEAMMAGCIVVAPALNDYLHKYADSGNVENYPFLIETQDKQIDMKHYVECLYKAIQAAQNPELMNYYSEMNKELAFKYASYEHSATIIANDLNKLLEIYNK
jgi:glycosyltransferase involved in cell wall biosynthesis